MPSTASDCRLTDNMKQLTPIICLPHIHFDKPQFTRWGVAGVRVSLKATWVITIIITVSRTPARHHIRQLATCFNLRFTEPFLIHVSARHHWTSVPWRESGSSWFSWCFPRVFYAQPKRPEAGPATRTASDGQLMASTRLWAVFSGRTTSEGYTRSVLDMYCQYNCLFRLWLLEAGS